YCCRHQPILHSFPTRRSSDLWVTSVGGTSMIRNGTTIQEKVWNSNGGGSGGGFSDFFTAPAFQKALPASVQSLLKNRRGVPDVRSEEHTSELQSLAYLVCRLL